MIEIADLVQGPVDTGILIIADHASAHVPADLNLGIGDELLGQHVAVDIGVDPLCRQLARMIPCPAILARVSRLVVDLNRLPTDPQAIPAASDGHAIRGNEGLDALDREARLGRFWKPYHALIEQKIEQFSPKMLISLHSFTPALRTQPELQRPWEIGILYNEDDRAASRAIGLLRDAGVPTGDNLPYSGKVLNTTMNLHAESRGLPYLGIEVRQDLIEDFEGVDVWALRLADLILKVRDAV